MKNMIYVGNLGFQLAVRGVLFDLFANRTSITLVDSRGILRTGVIQVITHEDGSGHSYNVTMTDGMNKGSTFHIRTIK